MPVLIIVVAAAACGMGAFTAFAAAQDRSDVRKSLRSLEGYRVAGVRDQEMLQPFNERVLAPLLQGGTKIVDRWTPAGYREKLARKVELAGNPAGYEVDRTIALQAMGACSGVVWGPLLWFAMPGSALLKLIAIALAWGGSFLMPALRLDDAVKRRQKAISRALPDMVDLLVISVDAGLGFEQALDRTAHAMPGPLSDEFRRMLQESRLGTGRAEALRGVDQRTQIPELRAFVMALIQADAFGVPIAKILRSQADEVRTRRRLFAQELAHKAPVKMLFPLVMCIFPAVFVIVLGPALITVSEKL